MRRRVCIYVPAVLLGALVERILQSDSASRILLSAILYSVAPRDNEAGEATVKQRMVRKCWAVMVAFACCLCSLIA